jgi:hypothetical protein
MSLRGPMTFRWTRYGSATVEETEPGRPSRFPGAAAGDSDHAVGQNGRCRLQAGLRALCRSPMTMRRAALSEIPVSPAGVALADRDGDSRRSGAVRAHKVAGDPASTA